MTNLDTKYNLFNYIIKSIYMQKSYTVLNSNKILKEYDNLRRAIVYNDIYFVETKILDYEHDLYHLDLNFRQSLFLRKFKNPSFDNKKKCLILFFSILILFLYYIF